jgi:hypothetical protein
MVVIQRSTTTTTYLPQSNLLFGFAGALCQGEAAVLNANPDQFSPAPALGIALNRRNGGSENPALGGLDQRTTGKTWHTTGHNQQFNNTVAQKLIAHRVYQFAPSTLSERVYIGCWSPWRQAAP